MKSPMIQSASYIEADEKPLYSELQVMRSGAGYYVGTIFHNPEGYDEPGSRDSHYFRTRAEAEAYLKRIEAGDPTAIVRMMP